MSINTSDDAPLQSLIAVAAMSVLFAAITLVAGTVLLTSAAAGRAVALVTVAPLLFYRVGCMSVEGTFLVSIEGMELDADQLGAIGLMAITTGVGVVLLAAILVMLLHSSSASYYRTLIELAKQRDVEVRPTSLTLAAVLCAVFSVGWIAVSGIGLVAALVPEIFPLLIDFPGGQLGLLLTMGPMGIVGTLTLVNAVFLLRDSVSAWRFSRVFNLLLLGGLVCVTTAFLATLGMDRMTPESSEPGMPDWLLEAGSVLLLVQMAVFSYTVYMLHSPNVDWYFRVKASQRDPNGAGPAPRRFTPEER